MGFYKNTKVTHEIIATKLASQIYHSFHRQELKLGVKLKMYLHDKNRTYPVIISRTERDVIYLYTNTRPRIMNDSAVELLQYLKSHQRNMEKCNIALIKYYLLRGYDIMWWDNYGNEHGYNLNATLK